MKMFVDVCKTLEYESTDLLGTGNIDGSIRLRCTVQISFKYFALPLFACFTTIIS